MEQKEDGSFVTHSHLSIKATSIELLHDHHSWQHYNHHHHHHLNSTPLQAGAGPDLEAVCYATNEVLGADSVATCLHIKERYQKCHLSTYERYQKCYKHTGCFFLTVPPYFQYQNEKRWAANQRFSSMKFSMYKRSSLVEQRFSL